MDTAELRHTFSTRIRKLRDGEDLNQGEFADRVGVSRGAMSYYEQEARTPDIGVLRAICTRYNVSADYLLGIIPDPNHTISDVCRETGLSPVAAKKLNTISRLVRTDYESYEHLMDELDVDFLDALKLSPFTSLPEVLNVLMESDHGMNVLMMLGAIILGAELEGASEKGLALKMKSASKNFEVRYPVENITSALWVNIQNDADRLKQELQPQPPAQQE